MYSTMKIDDT